MLGWVAGSFVMFDCRVSVGFIAGVRINTGSYFSAMVPLLLLSLFLSNELPLNFGYSRPFFFYPHSPFACGTAPNVTPRVLYMTGTQRSIHSSWRRH